MNSIRQSQHNRAVAPSIAKLEFSLSYLGIPVYWNMCLGKVTDLIKQE